MGTTVGISGRAKAANSVTTLMPKAIILVLFTVLKLHT